MTLGRKVRRCRIVLVSDRGGWEGGGGGPEMNACERATASRLFLLIVVPVGATDSAMDLPNRCARRVGNSYRAHRSGNGRGGPACPTESRMQAAARPINDRHGAWGSTDILQRMLPVTCRSNSKTGMYKYMYSTTNSTSRRQRHGFHDASGPELELVIAHHGYHEPGGAPFTRPPSRPPWQPVPRPGGAP